MLPSSSDLSYFLEAGASLNLSRAAERLGISQPSLSLSIQRLEHSIGAPLLIRSRKGVALTQAGKQLMSHARGLLRSWDSVKGQALASMNEIQGSYRIGCHPSVALNTLPGFLPQLLEDFPALELKLEHDLSRRIAESVIRFETDIGIVVNPVRHPDLMIRKLGTDEVTVWVGEGKRKVQDPRSGDATLVCDPELMQTQALLRKLDRSGIRFRRVLATSSLEVMAQLVASGAGIGLIPGRVVAGLGDAGLRKVPKAPVIQDEHCVIYRMENARVRSIQEIVGRIAKSFQSS